MLDLEAIGGGTITHPLVTVAISKIASDRTQYDTDDSVQTYSFFRSDKNSVYKTGSNKKLLWLSDFRTGQTIDTGVKTIRNYRLDAKYNLFGKYLGQFATETTTLSVTPLENGLYELSGAPESVSVITLDSGETIFVANDSYYRSES